MELTSPNFDDGGDLPAVHALDGGNVSPPLQISAVDGSARSLVLLMDAPDSPLGCFTHWLLWNLAPATSVIEQGEAPPEAEVGLNGFGRLGYAGPCPALGRHAYRFRLFALDIELEATTGDRRDQIEDEMKDHVMAVATLTGHCAASV